MINSLKYPFDYAVIQRKKRVIKKALESSERSFITKKIAILGGSTTIEIQNILELFLLNNGIKPVFYLSEYNRFYEDIISNNTLLKEFQPDFIYFHTTSINISSWPEYENTEETIENKLQVELAKFQGIWKIASQKYGCQIIQNNFENLNYRELGNSDTASVYGKNNFITRLNALFLSAAKKFNNIIINDINYLSSQLGLNEWHDHEAFFNYKYAISYKGMVNLAHNISSIINTQLGRSKKCLILDLDNTLWGGVIGDDGVGGIALGNETALGESFVSFQKYVKRLKSRGIILAVCSKNELENAKIGFSHPDSNLKVSDFSEFVANWDNKDQSIKKISQSLNIGMDSLLFVDDNPAEREYVAQQIKDLNIANFGESIITLMEDLDRSLYFDTIGISNEDLARNSYYKENKTREEFASEFKSYEEYLLSLEMKADVLPFSNLYFDRISQLTNKTNQFNLTTKRCSISEIEAMSDSEKYISFCMRLMDRFGDNGVVTVFSGVKNDHVLDIELWLMSCRVFKRTLENSVFDHLIKECKKNGIEKIKGHYFPTPKNIIVESFYSDLGFSLINVSADRSTEWMFNVDSYIDANKIIKTQDEING